LGGLTAGLTAETGFGAATEVVKVIGHLQLLFGNNGAIISPNIVNQMTPFFC